MQVTRPRSHTAIRFACGLVIGVMVCLCLCGCLASYSYHEYTIRTVDSETGRAILYAQVYVRHAQMEPIINHPGDVDVQTDSNGIATVRVADLRPNWIIHADGYESLITAGTDFMGPRNPIPRQFRVLNDGVVEIPLKPKR